MATSEKPFELRTPVLLVIFNRPDTTHRVFEAIRKAKPKKLYVAADGPREEVESDIVKCKEARSVVDKVDWDCEVKTLFRDENLNCGIGPYTAFNWFFENEEQGIILEDDCLPSQSFFRFCQELLERYHDDERIMHIGGNNFLDGWQKEPNQDYYFSQNGHIWGWATWRRAWKNFDYEISNYPEIKRQGYFNHFFLNRFEKAYHLRYFDKTINTPDRNWWDYQWDFARWANYGLSIVPNKNLVKNIGFGEDATHTLKHFSIASDLNAEEISFPLRHPKFVMRDVESDERYIGEFFKNNLIDRIKNLVL